MTVRLLAAVAAIALAVPAAAQQAQQGTAVQQQGVGGGETRIEMSRVPQAVMQAAERAVSGVQWSYAQTEQEDGRTVYEIGGENAQGQLVEVDVLEDGTIEEIERQITMQDVPQQVQQALQREVQGFRPSLIETSERDGQVAMYEFEGTADGQETVVEIAPDGSVESVAQAD